MKALVVYESMFGNTEAVARAVADGLGEAFEVRLAEARDIPSTDDVDLLVVGAPTHAFGLSRPSTRQDAAKKGEVRPATADVGIREYLDLLPARADLAAAAFDTKVAKPALPGSAAHKAHRRLRRLGCRMARPPETFKVTGTTGPLLAGELERAQRWAAELATAEGSLRHTA
ncbi:flavodoxin family protein [Paractinoplanes brasiliensis]|uniref:Flavodoxin-like protein n=1 Tax=Paractinoplanes brasiliensis TaxID=52695 RepID=A0A4R6JLQ4_9ACTN|nr:flavodoxin domain-containing protein [Actinoplanes brasiliensis]TDO36747.1 flavodoxin-like protein [Actinoplanes brasiliensis]GID32385.1 flavodoxin [Actinoplanes brasiliensis]